LLNSILQWFVLMLIYTVTDGTKLTHDEDLFMFTVNCVVPSSPRIVQILSRNATAVVIRWDAPQQRNGKLLGYQLNISCDEERTSVNITSDHTSTYQITDLSKQSLSFVNLHDQ